MHHILVYGDSLSWGIIPNTRRRLSFAERWPGVMEQALAEAGHQARVIEDCLNGRRTAWDDPFKPGRNALDGLEQRMEINSPLALAIVMLGANDFQSVHQNNAWHSGQGLAAVIRAMRRAPSEPSTPMRRSPRKWSASSSMRAGWSPQARMTAFTSMPISTRFSARRSQNLSQCCSRVVEISCQVKGQKAKVKSEAKRLGPGTGASIDAPPSAAAIRTWT